MRSVMLLAAAGLFALVVALLTGSTPIAILVVVLAVAGIVALLRDWRNAGPGAPAAEPAAPRFEEYDTEAAPAGLSPDEFSPDISTDPDGPSSDARAD
ncbi:MAG: hypothetical protein ACR2JM_10580 [Mycobacterium sp.]